MAEKTDLSQFEARLGDVVASSFIVPGLALGDSLGLFKLMVDLGGPKSSQEIADAGNFKERYIREWLALMVTSKVIEYDDSEKTYYLPPERLPALTGNIPLFQVVLSSSFQHVRKCFYKEGPAGTQYTNYPLFEEFMNGRTISKFDEESVRMTYSKVPGLLEKLEKGIDVNEFGCGNGHLLLLSAKLFPNSKFQGSDLSETAVADANEKAKERGLTNIQFVTMDVYKTPSDWQDKWDLVLVNDLVHDLGKPLEGLKVFHKVLKPGGHFLMIDIVAHSSLEKNKTVPNLHMYYCASTFYCMPFSLGFCEGGAGLGTCWGRELACEMVEKAGFKVVLLDCEYEKVGMIIVGTK